MKIMTLAALLLVLPQLASARVYMCVDQVTGETSFTDKACTTAGDAREEVRVDRTNLDSGKRARPKSSTFRTASSVIKILPGLISR